jgi:phospholipid/cholesterol/gamma-HCH transport system substrate-binding protein
MKQNIVETLMGALVIAVALLFIYISYKSGNITTTQGSYPVLAKFNETGGISVGSDVRVGGVKIGTVSAQTLDHQTYRAILTLSLKNSVQLPSDSSAAIVSDGLIGNKYVSLIPGSEEDFLQAGSEVNFTQDSISIESLIGKFAFGSIKDGSKGEKKEDTEHPGTISQ